MTEADDIEAWRAELDAARRETDLAALRYWEGELDLPIIFTRPDDGRAQRPSRGDDHQR